MIGAFVARGEDLIWVEEDVDKDALLYPTHLQRPIERLIRGIHPLFPSRADWLLRARIYGTAPLNASEWGLLKVGAKRYEILKQEVFDLRVEALRTQGLGFVHAQQPVEAVVQSLTRIAFASLKEAMHWLLLQTERVNQQQLMLGNGQESPIFEQEFAFKARRWHGKQRTVGALLLDGNFKPWALAFKQPEIHPLYHAEWSLLDAYLRQKVTLRTPIILLSTLKPCKLCAGAWVSYGPKPLQVYYLSDDLGKMGQNTAFDLGSFAWKESGALGLGCTQEHFRFTKNDYEDLAYSKE